MKKIDVLKAQAVNLRAALVAQGVQYSLSMAQEAIAQQYGQPNWDTVCGLLKQAEDNPVSIAKPPVLADLLDIPEKVGVWKDGRRVHTYQVESFDWDLVARLHRPSVELLEFFAEFSQGYPLGLDEKVVLLQGDGHDISLTARQLQGGYSVLSNPWACWYVPALGVTLEFVGLRGWAVEAPEASQLELAIPVGTKSVKGVRVLALRSGEGAEQDQFVLVPPHLNAERISGKVRDEILRLQALDKALPDGQEDKEYTVQDVRSFIEALGCTWQESFVEVPGYWDTAN